MTRRPPIRERLAALLLGCLMAAPGCAGLDLIQKGRFDYFATPSLDDLWSAKIRGWQRRERADQVDVSGSLPAVAEAGGQASPPDERDSKAMSSEAVEPSESGDSLRVEFASFLAERKRATACDFASWVQTQAKEHYVADGPIDHWATLEGTLRRDGDDCDGLELLAFHGLRDLGFEATKVFRSIVYRPSDGQHHMVTLWFEDPDDPWVIDPTGAMTTGMPRMSELPDWMPLKVFTEDREHTVQRGVATTSRTALLSAP
jgi:hypothetical protein